MTIKADTTIARVLNYRRLLTRALIAALLLHGLALVGLIWFSPSMKLATPGLDGDLHWISMVEPPSTESFSTEFSSTEPSRMQASPAPSAESRFEPPPPEVPAAELVAASPPIPMSAPGLGDVPAIGVSVATSPSSALEATSIGAGVVAMTQPLEPTEPMELVAQRTATEPAGRAAPEASSLPADGHRHDRVLAALPAQSRRAFDVYLGDFALGQRVASMDYIFESDGVHYRLRTEGRATGLMGLIYGGLLTQDSRGRIGPEGLLPERYTERRGERAARFVTFDRSSGLAEADDGATQPLLEGVQDQLSALWQLALIARLMPTQVALGHELRWPIARGRRVHEMRIVSHGEETLHPAQSPPIRALHLTLTAAVEPEDGRLEVWLASDDGMQLIRMKMTSAQGLVLDQMVRGPK